MNFFPVLVETSSCQPGKSQKLIIDFIVDDISDVDQKGYES